MVSHKTHYSRQYLNIYYMRWVTTQFFHKIYIYIWVRIFSCGFLIESTDAVRMFSIIHNRYCPKDDSLEKRRFRKIFKLLVRGIYRKMPKRFVFDFYNNVWRTKWASDTVRIFFINGFITETLYLSQSLLVYRRCVTKSWWQVRPRGEGL